MRKRKLFYEAMVIYLLCVLSYVMLTGVIYQYYETIKADSFKPEKILLYLLYTAELLFIVLFSPIFALKQFAAIDAKITKTHATTVHSDTSFSNQFLFEIILKSFILLSIFHIISLFSIYKNTFFSFQGYLMMLLVIFILSLFIAAFTSFLIFSSRNVSFSIAAVYITIIGIFGCVFFISPLLDLVSDPTCIINLTLNINPMMAIASILKFDLLRWGIFYESSQIGLFRFSYPHWSIHVLSYLALFILFFAGTFLLSNYYKKIKKQEVVLTF
ncbi:hypothetical protein S225a_18970 [Candidatus Brocadiaceae bacterium S225]|nr:hypothetical protein S225a_18970 [Candidatus Brocadiaceae bacterium S225]